jgi:HlyD family secretion protein
MSHLFPKEIIDQSQEHLFSTHSVKSRLIYSTIVLFVIGMMAALPFIYTDVGIRSRGMIRPVTEVVKIASPVSAEVITLEAIENSLVKENDIIATLDDADVRQRQHLNRSRYEQIGLYLADLITLIESSSFSSITLSNLRSMRYEREAREFGQQLASQQQQIDQHERTLERDMSLYRQDAISKSLLEERQHLLKVEENKLKLITEQQINSWNREKDSYQRERDELEAEFNQLSNERRLYVIRSPISGTLQNTNGILEKSFVFANQSIGEISPDTNLVAEVYVSPQEIGLLKEGLAVRLQIDAFDHNQWGTATGEIESISTDMIMSQNTPMFKVSCSINQPFLELHNGFRGDIKKGMTFQARFIINRRSLFQLLYDNMDDWINPAWNDPKNDTVTANS